MSQSGTGTNQLAFRNPGARLGPVYQLSYSCHISKALLTEHRGRCAFGLGFFYTTPSRGTQHHEIEWFLDTAGGQYGCTTIVVYRQESNGDCVSNQSDAVRANRHNARPPETRQAARGLSLQGAVSHPRPRAPSLPWNHNCHV